MRLRASLLALSFCILVPLLLQSQSSSKPKVLLIGVNGMEWDILRPLLLQGKLPNLASVIQKGAYGKLQTVPAPNCPRVYTTMFTSTRPDLRLIADKQPKTSVIPFRGCMACYENQEPPIWIIECPEQKDYECARSVRADDVLVAVGQVLNKTRLEVVK